MRGLLAAFAAVTRLLYVDAATSDVSECATIETCYLGGDSSSPCIIADGGCPPCVLFDGSSCYMMVDSKCPFGTDCSAQFSSPTNTSSSNNNASMTDASSTMETSRASEASSSTSSRSAGNHVPPGVTDPSSSSSDKSDTLLVFAIISVAIGVVAVAMILVAMVRHARAATDSRSDIPSPDITSGTASIASFTTTAQPVDTASRSAAPTMLKNSILSTSGHSHESLQHSMVPHEEEIHVHR